MAEDLRFIIDAQDKFSRTLGKAERKVGHVDRKTNKLNATFSKLGKLAGGLGVAAAFTGIANNVVQTTKRVRELQTETAKLTNTSGHNLDRIVANAKSVADTYDQDYKEVIQASNAVAKNFETTQVRALELINKGFLKGADASGEFLEQIKEYAPRLKESEMQVQTLFGTIAAGAKEGIFKDKLPDAVAEFSMRIKEQTSATHDALVHAFGKRFTKELEKGVRSGSISTISALDKVSKQIRKTEPDIQQMQQLTADLFGEPGEQLGTDFLRRLDKITSKLKEQKRATDDLVGAQSRMQKLNKELTQAQIDFARSTEDMGNFFQETWTQIKTGFYKGITDLNTELQILFGNISQFDAIESIGSRKQLEVIDELTEKNKDIKDPKKRAKANIMELERSLEFQQDMLSSAQDKLSNTTSSAMGRFNDALVSGLTFGAADAGAFGDPATDAASKVASIEGRVKALKKAIEKREKRLNQLGGGDDDGNKDKQKNKQKQRRVKIPKTNQQNSVEKIKAQAPKTFNIRIEKMIEEFVVQSETVEGSRDEIKRIALESLLSAINDMQSA